MTPLTLAEARAILVADKALKLSYNDRLTFGQTLKAEEVAAWERLLESALDRIDVYEGQRRTP